MPAQPAVAALTMAARKVSFSRRRSSTASSASSDSPREGVRHAQGQAAAEGIAALKAGSRVIKHGRNGISRTTVLSLSPDERTLTWDAPPVSKLRPKSERREVQLADARALLIGRESHVFQRHQSTRTSGGERHLSLSIVLRGARAALGVRLGGKECRRCWRTAPRATSSGSLTSAGSRSSTLGTRARDGVLQTLITLYY